MRWRCRGNPFFLLVLERWVDWWIVVSWLDWWRSWRRIVFFGLTIWGWTLCRSVFFHFFIQCRTNLLVFCFLVWVWMVWERRNFLLIHNRFFTILELSLNCWRVCSDVLTVGGWGWAGVLNVSWVFIGWGLWWCWFWISCFCGWGRWLNPPPCLYD